METYALKKETLYQSLRREILSEKYAPESRLPKELDFCRQLGVAKVTLRSALEKLEADGLVARIPGKGTFISARHKSNLILVCIVKKSGIELPQNYILPGIEAMASELGFRTELCFIDYLRNLSSDYEFRSRRRSGSPDSAGTGNPGSDCSRPLSGSSCRIRTDVCEYSVCMDGGVPLSCRKGA